MSQSKISAVMALANPFSAYALGFLLAMGVYSLGYSDLYPPLQAPLVYFLLTTCAASGLLAFAVSAPSRPSPKQADSLQFHILMFVVLLFVFAAECVYSGGLPILMAAAGVDSDYQNFGIPTINVAFISLTFFYSVYWFDLYLLGRGKTYVLLALAASSISLLILHRGGFIITFVGWMFTYIQRHGLSRRLILGFVAMFALLLWGFGQLGTLRAHGDAGEEVILDVGQASDSFRESEIPIVFFWSYLYISSPLSNLQLNMTNRVSTDSPNLYFALEFLPDFLSKRLVSEESMAAAAPLLVTDQLNVSTMYARAYFLMGWLGLFLSFSYFVVICLVCMRILRQSKYYVTTVGILSSLAFLNIFDNMFIVAGGITQLIIALTLHLFEKGERAQETLGSRFA